MTSYAPWDADAACSIIAEKQAMPGALLPILHALQEEFGYIDRAAEPLIAEILNLTRAEVHGVVTFYHDFRHTLPARHVLKLCRAEACQAMGADALALYAAQKTGIALGNTTGGISLEPVYCLGLCAVAPSAMFDGRVIGRLDTNKLDALVAEPDR